MAAAEGEGKSEGRGLGLGMIEGDGDGKKEGEGDGLGEGLGATNTSLNALTKNTAISARLTELSGQKRAGLVAQPLVTPDFDKASIQFAAQCDVGTSLNTPVAADGV